MSQTSQYINCLIFPARKKVGSAMDTLVSHLSSRTDTSNDLKIVEFALSSVDQLVSDWTYAAGTSNHGKFGTYTLALVTLFNIPEFSKEAAVGIAKKIINEEIKVVYRALTMERQAQTIPTISLLKHFALLIPVEVFNQFDFTLRVIPKLMAHQPFRKEFLQFYMVMIRHCPAPTRRELLANRKVLSGWFGKLGQDDSEETIGETFDLLREYVLNDVSVFTKTSKMGLFNDWTLKNIQRVLASPQISERIVEKICKFITTLLCDKTYGVRLPGENKLALSFLKIVKPWENAAQLDLVIILLREMSELVVPYFESLSTAYPLTPKASMWWFSYSVLHIRVLKFAPPSTNTNALPKPQSISKSILPITVTKQAIQQALSYSESALVQFQAAQIVLFALRRLRSTIINVYEPNNWDPLPLVDEILNTRLPDPHFFTKQTSPALLQTTYLMILKEYCQLHPMSLNIDMALDAEEVKGLKLLQAQQVLEVQTFTSDQTRWWNPTKGEASLFTQLAKFSTFNISLANKCSQLLQHLVQPTQIFTEIYTLAHPIDALLFTLSSNHGRGNSHMAIIWDVLEQAVQRSTRFPYQYIDRVQSTNVSPILVALVEQYKHHFAAKGSKDAVACDWICSFGRSLIVLGEDKRIIDELCASISDNSNLLSSNLKSNEYFDFVLDEPDATLLKRSDILLKISNNLELAATLYRAATTANIQVRNHLLANIPNDMLQIVSEHPAAFLPFLKGSSDLCKALLVVIDGNCGNNLRVALEKSDHWHLALPLVTTEFLMAKLTSTEDFDNGKAPIILELNRRKSAIPLNYASQLIKVEGLADNLLLYEPKSVDSSGITDLMARAINDPKLTASLIRISGVYDSKHPLAFHPSVLVAGAKFAHSQVDAKAALATAERLLTERGHELEGLSVASGFIDSLREEVNNSSLQNIWGAITEYIERARHEPNTSVMLVQLSNLSELDPPYVPRWLKVMIHQLTRRCAENNVTDAIKEFIAVLNTNNVIFRTIWQHVHPNAINALIEAILNSARLPETYELLSNIAMNEQRPSIASSKLTSLAHLSTLFDKTKPQECSLDDVVAIYALYNSNPVANSTLDVEQGVLIRYNGSITAKDRILLLILRLIEEQRQRSWIDNVDSWEIRPAHTALLQDVDDYGQDPLIKLKNSNSAFVTLDEQRIWLTIQSFEIFEQWHFPSSIQSFSEIRTFAQTYELKLPKFAMSYYDSSFLLACIVSCEYLLQNVEVLLNSGLLSFVICCLSNPHLHDTAHKLLMHIFNRLPGSQFKDHVGVRLLLGRLLMLETELKQHGKPFPSHIPGMVGQLALVISRPNHFLHEKVCSWLLSSPKLQTFDVPLFKTIFNSQSDLKPRELLWMINTLKSGAVDNEAVQTFIKAGIIDWCLSQYQLLNPKLSSLKEAVKKFIDRIEELNDGSLTLISDAGALSMPEFKEKLFYTAGPVNVACWSTSS